MAGPPPRRSALSRWIPRRWWLVYLLMLPVSAAYEQEYRSDGAPRPVLITQFRTNEGALSVGYRVWPVHAGALGPDAPVSQVPVILIHGSPGEASDFERLGSALRDTGDRVIALDLPGFGATGSTANGVSALEGARVVLASMDALDISRAHIVGWSLGGAVALHMADLAPDRVASLTLMASVSEQATEGSGNFYYEHAKYASGWTLATAVRYGVPHFGLLSGLDVMRASMRNFWDTDLRPLRGIMERLQTPTLILHGWRDFLAPVHDAQRSHQLIGPSTLVIFDGTHFIPFMHVDTAASVLVPFFARHDTPGVVGLRQAVMLDPEPRPVLGLPGAWLNRLILAAPWWLMIALVAIGTVWRDRLTLVLAVVMVSFVLLDFGVAMGGVLLGQALLTARNIHRGRSLRRVMTAPRIIGSGLLARTPCDWREMIRRRPCLTGVASRFVPGGQAVVVEAAAFNGSFPILFLLGVVASWVFWALLFAVLSLLAAALVVHPLADRLGTIGLLAGTAIAIYLSRPIALSLTRDGRRVFRITFHRATRREYWPTIVQYALLSPVLLRQSLRDGLLAYTCCNPGISGGGGMIGESKKAILDSLGGSPHVLPATLIEPDVDGPARARAALDAIATRPELGGFPTILKPDAGQRGFAVKIARTPADVVDYFRTVASPVLVQRFHLGPCECGIVWMRRIGPSVAGEQSGREGGRIGSIFSITRKDFPVITGDGRRTLEELIARHPRFHCQAAVFLERFADQRGRVLGAGETLRLAQSGNHCQGTLFRDGADLITPELEAAIDALARGISPPLDAGRFDLRYESDEALRRGEGFAIIELNGTAGESTNIYDPERSIFWAYRTLAAQWRLLYELGAERRREGARPMTVMGLLREMCKHYRERTGSALAD